MEIVKKRIRKYFSDKDGNLMEFMKERRDMKEEMLETITLQKNLFKITMPESTYTEYKITYYWLGGHHHHKRGGKKRREGDPILDEYDETTRIN